MTNSTFCPVCQRKNKTETKRCAYCGSGLSMEMSGIGVHTTLNITPSISTLQEDTRCQEYLKQLPKGDICIIFEKKQTPIILHNIAETVLGRFFDDSENNSLDLDPYGGGAYGVSRRHARIICVDDKFVFEDLNSTNGSWLNGQRIPSGTTYPLMSEDQIWLGQFKMQVCFHQGENVKGNTLFLYDTIATSKNLSPDRLLTQFAPYLKTISDFQAIISECLQLDFAEVNIGKIDASDSDDYIVVHISNNPEAIHLIRKWISPWKREHPLDTEDDMDPSEQKNALVQLTSKIIADIAPDLTNEARFSIIEKALPVVTKLVTDSIELSFEV